MQARRATSADWWQQRIAAYEHMSEAHGPPREIKHAESYIYAEVGKYMILNAHRQKRFDGGQRRIDAYEHMNVDHYMFACFSRVCLYVFLMW